MVNISKSENSIKFVFTDSDHYLYGNGEIEVPVNSLLLVIDESEMVTFKKLSGDPFLSFRADNSNLGTKAAIEQFYKDNMVGSTGGGSESGITPSEVQTMIDESISGKADTSAVTAVANDVQTVSGQVATKVAISDFNAYSAATNARIAEDEEVTAAALNDLQENKADTSAVTTVSDALTAHTSNTSVHVTSADKTAWNNKSDFSGDYNDLTNKPTIPTVPTNISDFTNDAGYITNADIAGKADTSAVTAVANDVTALSGAVDDAKAYYIDFTTLATVGISDDDWDGIVAAIDDHRPIYAGYPRTDGGIIYYGVECMNKNSGNTEIVMTASDNSAHYFYTFTKNGSNDYSYTVSTKPYVPDITTAITSGSTDAQVPSAKATYDAITAATTGGGATYSAGTNISIENDVISVNLPIEKKHFWNGDGIAIIGNANGFSDAAYSAGIGFSNTISASRAFILGSYCHAKAQYSVALNANNIANAKFSLAANQNTTTNNVAEAAFGTYNNSVTGSTTSGQTLFSVGNGTANNARHNAFEIRQNGDIYVNDGTNDVRLQDTILALGGLKFVQCSQSDYDAMVSGGTIDSSTIYFITNVVS